MSYILVNEPKKGLKRIEVDDGDTVEDVYAKVYDEFGGAEQPLVLLRQMDRVPVSNELFSSLGRDFHRLNAYFNNRNSGYKPPRYYVDLTRELKQRVAVLQQQLSELQRICTGVVAGAGLPGHDVYSDVVADENPDSLGGRRRRRTAKRPTTRRSTKKRATRRSRK